MNSYYSIIYKYIYTRNKEEINKKLNIMIHNMNAFDE